MSDWGISQEHVQVIGMVLTILVVVIMKVGWRNTDDQSVNTAGISGFHEEEETTEEVYYFRCLNASCDVDTVDYCMVCGEDSLSVDNSGAVSCKECETSMRYCPSCGKELTVEKEQEEQ